MLQINMRASELDELAELTEMVAHDPDAQPPARYYELLRECAHEGATIGWRERFPAHMSIGPAFFAALSGAAKGVQNAS